MDFEKVLEDTINHYRYNPIVMQVNNNQLFKRNAIPRSEQQDFMDRKILLVKPKFKIRDSATGKLHTLYIEMSVLRNKVYFTNVDLKYDKEMQSAVNGSPWRMA